jgi:hypothetical protein
LICRWNNGQGDVDTLNKNILLFSPSTEKLAAVYDGNNHQYWIITHEWNNNIFNCYKIDTAGIHLNPVSSAVGTIHSGGVYGSNHNALGQMVISPDGQHVACALSLSGVVELFDFDVSSGVVSNAVTIMGYPWAFGLAYSPTGQAIYLVQLTFSDLTQFDLTNYNSVDITNSATLVGTVTSSGILPGYTAAYLQLGPDGKIYVSHVVDSVLGAVTQPDVLGASCNYVDHFVDLQGKICEPGLSSAPVFINTATGIARTDPAIHLIRITPNPAKGQFIIECPVQAIQQDVSMQMFAADGRLVHEEKLKSPRTLIARSNLPPGTYLCKFIDKKGFVQTMKIVLE